MIRKFRDIYRVWFPNAFNLIFFYNLIILNLAWLFETLKSNSILSKDFFNITKTITYLLIINNKQNRIVEQLI